MENGERKKLSSTLSDGDHKEENSLYLFLFRVFDSLTQRSRRPGGWELWRRPRSSCPPGS